jgi:lipid II:glycine glycyltransferase (peptidoglycan interpeptide bridge formation enzyme)
MNSVDLFSPFKDYYLNTHFNKPKILISSGYTIINDLTLGLDQILNNLNSKRRYYLKSALKQNLEWRVGLNKEIVDDLKLVFNKFSKDNKNGFKIPNNQEIDHLSNYKNDFVYIVGYKYDVAITASIINVTNQVPLYLYSAATSEGRKLSASYAMICKLHEYLYQMGYKNFDLAGISPFKVDIAGINKFKLTFSGQIAKYNGEWEYGTYLNRVLFNFLIKLKSL